MYRCQMCDTLVPPKTKANFLVTKTRVKFYSYRPKVNYGFTDRGGVKKKSRRNSDRVDDPGGKGLETIEELCVCPKCYQEKKLDLNKDK